ncbi:MAG: nucleotide exchange factor GrpE [Microthrixaceae bacterium]
MTDETPSAESSSGEAAGSLDSDLGGQADKADQTAEDRIDVTDDGAIDGDLVEMVEVGVRLQKERDEYLDLARRVQADFENYKRRVEVQKVEQRERAAEGLAAELLPVLDAGEAASAQGLEDATALYSQLLVTLEKHGLEKVNSSGVEFDPNVHEAVIHEEGDSDSPIVEEVLRTGYLWNARVIRPAMVKVRG